MPKLFKKNPEGTLIALAVVFFAIMLCYFILGVTTAVGGITDVFSANKNQPQNVSFNLSAASQLNLRGLVQ